MKIFVLICSILMIILSVLNYMYFGIETMLLWWLFWFICGVGGYLIGYLGARF